jgi:hypothetical protein
MATVYITKELSNQIKRRIEKMRDHEVESDIPKHDKSVELDASELLMQASWGDHLHVLPQLPKDWLKKSMSQEINVITTGEDGQEQKYCVTVGRLTNYYEIPTAERWGAPRPQCTKAWLESKLHLVGAQEMLERLSDKEVRTTIFSKWDKVNADIQLFLNKCKSLNEALRLWPALKMYVPEEYIDRVNHKVERRQRETDIIETVDIGGLTAAAIAAKLSGAV